MRAVAYVFSLLQPVCCSPIEWYPIGGMVPFFLLLTECTGTFLLPPADETIAVTDRPVAHRVASHPHRRRQPKALAREEAAAKAAAKLQHLSQPYYDTARNAKARKATIVYAIFGKHDSQELALWQRTWLQVSE